MTDDDTRFLDGLADALIALPGVRTVALGGSRAAGLHSPDSDWDLALYYRDGEGFDPADLRAVGWPGEVSELGGWGGGVFNGGAWLEVEGRRVDVHYRDLAVVEHELAEAGEGRFHREPLLFHLAGIPSYLLLAELSVNRVLRGEALPRPEFPEALRRTASAAWRGDALLTLDYAEANAARRGAVTEVAGAIALAALQAAHGVLAERGEWITNEKRLLDRAGLRAVDAVVGGLRPDPEALGAAVRAARALLERAR